jgi:hypothetical protein
MDAHNVGSNMSEDSSGSTGTQHLLEIIVCIGINCARRPRAQVPEDRRSWQPIAQDERFQCYQLGCTPRAARPQTARLAEEDSKSAAGPSRAAAGLLQA